MELPERKIYTVSELTERIRVVLEKEYPSVWVQGEVSNLRSAPSGHMYFTLKDDAAQIRSVMFRLQSRFLKFKLEDGLRVIAWGRLSVYSARGEYQLILDTMEPAGLGSLMLAFEQLRDRLAAEGLFDPSKKRTIPPLPKRIGIVTSPSGAAVQDMIRIIRRRLPGTHILVSPATVQGDRAPEEIVTAMRRLCEAGDVDVVIVGRGGGSIEDLWAFNDEKVVRAVASCPLPVVSAVGHETDFTLTDFAADLRASTPSAAAEMVVPDKRNLQEAILSLFSMLRNCMHASVDRRRAVFGEMLSRLQDPRRQIQDRRIKADDLTLRLVRVVRRRIEELQHQTRSLAERLRPEHLARILLDRREMAQDLLVRLERGTRSAVRDKRTAAESLSGRLDALSPLAVLSRGYSITFRPDSRAVLTDARTVEVGDAVEVRLRQGELQCRVMGTKYEDDTYLC
jgi:exodeoxyribonuclease VII large subunit